MFDHAQARDREHGQADREVDEEDRAPAERVCQRSAEYGADGDGATDGCTPERDRGATLGPAVILRDQRQGGGEHAGSADTLQRARQIERWAALRETAEEG